MHIRQNLDSIPVVEDKIICTAKNALAAAFCTQELPEYRKRIRLESDNVHRACQWHSRGMSSHLYELQSRIINASDYTTDMPPWSASTPHGYEAQLKMRPAPSEDQDAPTSVGDLFGQPYPVELQRCELLYNSSSWTFDRMGPFYGHGGYSWYSAGWPDCGGFVKRLLDGEVWITAFGFTPTDADGRPFGTPPFHIHHMHVSTGQSLARFFGGKGHLPMFDSMNPMPVEFDMHGDRQCQASRGGTDCLIRSYPPGFGLQVTRAFHTFYDINDARTQKAPAMRFYTEHAFKWTHHTQRVVRHFATIIPSNIPFATQNVSLPGIHFPWHDDYLLRFSGFLTEYIAWSEQRFLFSGTLAHIFWHSHHQYTVDSWVISGPAHTLGLHSHSFDSFTNISQSSITVAAAMNYILDNLESAQRACLAHSCSVYPELRCKLNQDRWDLLDLGYQERYHDPLCNSWNVVTGDAFTVISFHHQLMGPVREKVWMHTVLYALVV